MGDLLKYLEASDLVDAYTDETNPDIRLGLTDLNRLVLTNNSSSVRRAWFSFLNTEFPSRHATVFDASLVSLARFPVEQGVSPVTFYIKGLESQHSVAQLTHNELVSQETEHSNWPLASISNQQIALPTQMAADYPSPSPDHVSWRVELDLKPWWDRCRADPNKLPSWGFVVEVSGLSAGKTLELLSSEVGSLYGSFTMPFLVLKYGLPVDNVSVVAVTDQFARITWDESPGASYYVVQISTDNGASWTELELTEETGYDLVLDAWVMYQVRVVAGYDSGRTDPSPEVQFTAAPPGDPPRYLEKPPSPTAAVDEDYGHVILTFPGNADIYGIDRWQIARHMGTIAQQLPTAPVDADIIAPSVSGQIKTWTDRFPQAFNATYWVRGRVDPLNDIWTDWSEPFGYDPPASSLRSNLMSPNNVLEIKIYETVFQTPINVSDMTLLGFGGVETDWYDRFSVSPGEQLQLEFSYRSLVSPGPYTMTFQYGLRWYDKDGLWISDSSLSSILVELDGDSPAGLVTFDAEVPALASRVGIFFDISSTSTEGKLRIERLSLYRVDESKDTTWEYCQVPSEDGLTPDTRDVQVDENVFTYDGVGWSALQDPPPTSPLQGPYRETNSADDNVNFIVSGSAVEFLFYGGTEDTVLAVEVLNDDLSIDDQTTSPVLPWTMVIDPSIGTYERGPDWMINGTADVDLDRWTSGDIPIITDLQNPFANALPHGTFARTTTSPISGPASFSFSLTRLNFSDYNGAYYIFGQTFLAGHRYELSVDVKKRIWTSGDGLKNPTISFGDYSGQNISIWGSAPIYAGLFDVAYQTIDDLVVGGPANTYKLVWEPKRDTNMGIFTLGMQALSDPGDNTEAVFDNISVTEIIGYRFPATTDFEVKSIKLPPLFSDQFPTPYRIRVVSGPLRPVGIRRDPANVLELTADFDTVLRSLGNMRNATSGEIEFRADMMPKRVIHHNHRGKDYTKLPGGLDLRTGKNLVTSQLTTEPNQVINRLILLGYGDDRTQLVLEVAAKMDRQGRVPSDPYYRFDRNGIDGSSGDPNWDVYTGGTSEEIYGPRYGTYRDVDVKTMHAAQELAQKLVEKSAWPTETYEIKAVDLGEVPSTFDVGDIVPLDFRGRSISQRLLTIDSDISLPRQFDLTLGEPVLDASAQIERVAKDVDTSLTFINQTTGAADSASTSNP